MAEGHRQLGQLLVEWGLLTELDLQQALAWHEESGRPLGVLLVERGLVLATKLTQVLSYQFNLPSVSLARVRFTPELLQALPTNLAHTRRAVPICRSGEEVLFVATDDPADLSLAADLSAATGKEVRLMVAAPDELQQALEEHYATGPSRRPSPPLMVPEPTGVVHVAASQVNEFEGRVSHVVELTEDELELISQLPEELLTVVVVESDAGFAGLCAQAAEAQGLRVEMAGLMSAEPLIQQIRPVAIVVMEDIFGMDRLMFIRVSIEVGAYLMIWSDELSSDNLEPLLAAAKQHHSPRASFGK